MKRDRNTDLRKAALWIHELEEGILKEENRIALMQLMREHDDIMDLYVENAGMSALLGQAAESRIQLGTMPVSEETLRREKRRAALASLSYAAAAVVLLAAGLLFLRGDLLVGGGQAAIRVESSDDAEFAVVCGEESRRKEGRLMPGDQVTVERGLLRFRFPSGVEGLVEGPSQIELISTNTLRMDQGMGWFRVPPKAKGFTVRTNRAQVIDLGTEFGVRFDRKGGLEVHVADGRVRVVPSAPNASAREVVEGEALGISSSGATHSLDLAQDLFRRDFSTRIPRIHWSFDEEIEGIFLPKENGSQSSEPAITVKNIEERDLGKCTAPGVFGDALSLDGKGTFAQADFAGFEGGMPATVAAWVRCQGSGSDLEAEHLSDSRKGLGVTMASGQQAYLLNYTNSMLTTKPEATGVVLGAGATHTLRFRVAALASDPSTEFKVELLAHDPSAPVVVASKSGVVESHDFSKEVSLSVTPHDGDPHLGKPLLVRLLKVGGRVLYDDFRLSVSRSANIEDPVFVEDFEAPRVLGYVEGVFPAGRWETPFQERAPTIRPFGSRKHGMISGRSMLSMPLIAWADSKRSRPWILQFNAKGEQVLSLLDGAVFYDGRVSSPLVDGRWVHVAIVQTGKITPSGRSETLMYVNGEPVEPTGFEPEFPFEVPVARAKMLIGAIPGSSADTRTLRADVDELHVFRSVLNKHEINTLMNENYVVFRRKEY